MRYREPFTIFPRKLKNGKTVWYYRTYTPDGRRTVAHSTGKTNKTQARAYCTDLIAKGMLYTGDNITFGAFATGFYDDNSEWMMSKKQAFGENFQFSKSTLTLYRYSLNSLLLPYFKRIKLRDISTAHIKLFRDSLVQKGLSNHTINSAVNCFKVIVKHAIANRYMTFDPFITIQPMYIAMHERDAYTVEELEKMFLNDWGEDNEIKYFAIVAAVTGMRIGEVTAIRRETLHENYLDVFDQIDKTGEQRPVKTKDARKIRICKTLYTLIDTIIGDGNFAFVSRNSKQRDTFYEHCMISEKERKERKLTFHSLRHFFNTYLLANGVAEIKVKSLMGHSSGRGSMTERYANFKPEHFDDVASIQENLLKRFGIAKE